MQDDKYQHFNTVLDIYITKHFSAMLAHRHVLLCKNRVWGVVVYVMHWQSPIETEH